MKRILFLFVSFILVCGTMFSSNSDFVIVIDAGHGGRDPGALRGTIKEKNIVLAVATELGKLLGKGMTDATILYTRKTDVFVPLIDRANYANKHKANLFISIHTNSTSAKTTSASGAETFILGMTSAIENYAVAKRENAVIKYEEDYSTKYEGFDPDSPESYIIFEFMSNQYLQQSLDFASYVQKGMKSTAKRGDRGVKQGGLLVLRESAMPSVLIELGFINNPTEAKYLTSSQGQKDMASAIFEGVKKYKAEFDKHSGTAPIKVAVTTSSSAPSKSPTPTVEREVSASSNIAQGEETEYRVQFLYSMKKLPEGSSLFKGVVPTGYTEDNGYKYTYGATTDYNEIVRMHIEVKKKFADAFIIMLPAEGKYTPSYNVVHEDEPAPTPAPTPTTINNAADQTNNSSVSADEVEYKIQFLYSQVKLSDNSSRFQGMDGVSYYEDSGFKYTVGSTTNYDEIRRLFAQVKKKFADAFIIRMKNGKRI